MTGVTIDLESDLHYACPLGQIRLEHRAGPSNFGMLTLVAVPGKVDAQSIAPILEVLSRWTFSGALQKPFVGIFDMGAMSLPSIFGLPDMYRLFKQHAPDLVAFRKYQQCFAAVRGDSYVFNAFTDAIIGLSNIETVPIFASDRKEARKLIKERFHDKKIRITK